MAIIPDTTGNIYISADRDVFYASVRRTDRCRDIAVFCSALDDNYKMDMQGE